MPNFSKLFEQIYLGNVWVKNRIVMAPMGLVGMINPDGTINERVIAYYEERAKGGVGLIITGLTRVENEIEKFLIEGKHALPVLDSLLGVTKYIELTERIHHYGTRIFVQLTAGTGRVIPSFFIMKGVKPVGPSEIPCFWVPTVKTRALKKEEIKQLVKAFGRAAELAYIAGFDGIEIHGHEGYLIDQFTSALWNKRKDEYGGTLENMLRFPIEILHAVKDATHKKFPVIYRFGLKHYIKGYNWPGLPEEEFEEKGRDIEEGLEMAKILEKAGYDVLHVDAGAYDSWYFAHPPEYLPHGVLADLAGMVKKVVNVPVIAVGRLDDPYVALRVIEEGKADMIAIGRGLLADPYWPKKVKRGEIEDIRPCIGCHECLYRIIETLRPLGCALNPITGREYELKITKAEESKKVVVVGGGIAGMEASRVAALRGHKVILFEKNNELGGLLRIISKPPFKRDIEKLREWYVKQLKKLNVDIRLGIEVDSKIVLDENPDVVIIATGSIPIVPPIPGADKPHVHTALEVWMKGEVDGTNILIVGAGLVGLETALWLAENKKKVEIVEMRGAPTLNISKANWLYLLTKLRHLGVNMRFNTKVKEIKDDSVILETPKGDIEVKADAVIIATGMKSNNKLYNELYNKHPEVHLIGDALAPRRIKEAVWDAFHIALSL